MAAAISSIDEGQRPREEHRRVAAGQQQCAAEILLHRRAGREPREQRRGLALELNKMVTMNPNNTVSMMSTFVLLMLYTSAGSSREARDGRPRTGACLSRQRAAGSASIAMDSSSGTFLPLSATRPHRPRTGILRRGERARGGRERRRAVCTCAQCPLGDSADVRWWTGSDCHSRRGEPGWRCWDRKLARMCAACRSSHPVAGRSRDAGCARRHHRLKAGTPRAPGWWTRESVLDRKSLGGCPDGMHLDIDEALSMSDQLTAALRTPALHMVVSRRHFTSSR